MILALTYSHTSDAKVDATGGTGALGPSDVVEGSKLSSARYVYGRGYEIEFAKPTASNLYSDFPALVLGTIRERNLETGAYEANNGGWICSSALQFRIVRGSDAGPTSDGSAPASTCYKKPDPSALTSTQQYVRNILRSEDWWIDWDNKCVVSKRSPNGCYGSVSNIKYTLSEACSATTTPACTHYVSICVR
jgi:hypothetical protein